MADLDEIIQLRSFFDDGGAKNCSIYCAVCPNLHIIFNNYIAVLIYFNMNSIFGSGKAIPITTNNCARMNDAVFANNAVSIDRHIGINKSIITNCDTVPNNSPAHDCHIFANNAIKADINAFSNLAICSNYGLLTLFLHRLFGKEFRNFCQCYIGLITHKCADPLWQKLHKLFLHNNCPSFRVFEGIEILSVLQER